MVDNNSIRDSSSNINNNNNTVDTSKTNSRRINRRSNNSSNSKMEGMEISYPRYSEPSRSVSVDELEPERFNDGMYKIHGIWRDDIDVVGALQKELGPLLLHILDISTRTAHWIHT